MQVGDVLRQPPPLGIGSRVRLDRQCIVRPAFGIGQDHRDAREQEIGDRPWQDDAMDQAAAQDTECDFLDAQGGHGKDRAGRLHARQRDQNRTVAGEHEHIGARRAIEQRHEHAQRQPRSDRQRQQFGRVVECGHHQHCRQRPDAGADQAEQRLGDDRAGQRLRHDIGGQERPIGPVEPDR